MHQLPTTIDALRRHQDDIATLFDALERSQDDISTTFDALKRDHDGMTTAIDALKRDHDGMTTTIGALKRDHDGMTTTIDALKRDQDDMPQLCTTVDTLKHDKDDMPQLPTTVDTLKCDQDDMRKLSATVDALKLELDKERSRTTSLEQRIDEMFKAPASCPAGYTMWRGICYKVFNTEKPFSRSAATCRKDGGTLAMPRDAETNAFLISLYKPVSSSDVFWFGLHSLRQEGTFEWMDGSALGAYNNWAPGQPNNDGRP
ncbi:CD209 antigen-like [Branchiostoma lanceolatum]|uniref:CD209 antigen-like n=1 Tax=Branchiostoma lanceolatum TaxID=7740 RepID=UPI0034522435